jgi:hypothetical protein
VELGEVMIDEVLLHLLDVREVSGRDLMLLELNTTVINVEFEARNDTCCGSGSRIRCFFDSLVPGSGIEKIWIRDPG